MARSITAQLAKDNVLLDVICSTESFKEFAKSLLALNKLLLVLNK